MEPVSIVVVVLGVLVAAAAQSWHNRQQAERARALTDGGWTPHDGPVGWQRRLEIEGVDVHLEHGVADARPWSRVTATVPGPLPPGFSFSREGVAGRLSTVFGGQDLQIHDPLLDEQLVVRCEVPSAARWILQDQQVAGCLSQLLEAHPHAGLHEGTLVIHRSDLDVDALEAAGGLAAELVRHLAAAYVAPLEALAVDGMTLQVGQAGVLVTGERAGRAVSAQLSGGSVELEIRASTALLPGALQIRGGTGGIGTRDPVLDAAVAVEAICSEDDARSVVTREGVRAPLLELVHGHPGSEVSDDEVVLRTSAFDVQGLAEALDLALELAAALSDRRWH